MEQGKDVRSPGPEEEGAAGTACDGLGNYPLFPVLMGRSRVAKQGIKLSLARREG